MWVRPGWVRPLGLGISCNISILIIRHYHSLITITSDLSSLFFMTKSIQLWILLQKWILFWDKRKQSIVSVRYCLQGHINSCLQLHVHQDSYSLSLHCELILSCLCIADIFSAVRALRTFLICLWIVDRFPVVLVLRTTF